MPIDVTSWQQRLDEYTAEGSSPAVSIAVLSSGQVQTLASGVLNKSTGVEATTDSVFQIGSVTKAYTATLLLSLAEDGLLDLDEPLITYMPELQWGDHVARTEVTTRHLLNHTSGIDGDHFLDLGRGEDVLERYVATCGELAQVLPVGATWSYCNTGFAVAGRLIEKLTSMTYDRAIAELLFEPLGLSHSCTLPEDALKFRAAYGHVPGENGLELAPVVSTPRTMGSAGGVISTAEEVIDFVRLYLDGGRTHSGRQLLSARSIEQAWEPQAVVWDPSMGQHWGLGWMLTEWGGKKVVGHDGGTVGQGSFVRVIPDEQIAVVLLGNGPGVGDLMPEIVGGIIEDLSGVPAPAPLEPDGEAVEKQAWFGSYERVNMHIEVTSQPEGARVEVGIGGLAADTLGTNSFTGDLARAADGTHLTNAIGDWMPLVPFTLEDGTDGVHFAGRAQPRVH